MQEKIMDFAPLPNGVTHLNIPPTDVKKNDKTNQKKIILAWALKSLFMY